MDYTLTRYEKTRDHDGNITGIFINVTLNNGEELYNHGAWLTPEEMASVVAASGAITSIAEQYAARGEIAFDYYLSVKPQATIIENAEAISLNSSAIAGWKAAYES